MILFFFLVSFVLGLLLIPLAPILISILALIYFAFLFFRIEKKFLVIALLIFGAGIGISQINITNEGNDGYFEGMVIESKENYYIFLSGGEKFYVSEEDNDKEFGDFLKIQGYASETKFTTYESQFDFDEYLSLKGVNRSLKAYEEEFQFKNPLRTKEIKSKFLANFDSEIAAIVDSFLFFNRDYESSFVSLASSIDIIYLFAVNGLYLSLLMNGLSKLLELKFSKRMSDLISIIVFIPYLLFVFYKVGLIRIFIYKIMKVINYNFVKKRVSNMTLLSALCFGFLLIDYHLVYQSGFYIGFLISFFLIFLGKTLNINLKKKTKFAIPILVYLFLVPISISFSSSFHPFAFIYQIILLPINLPFLLICLVSFFTVPFTNLISGYGNFLNTILSFFTKIDFSIYVDDYSIYFYLIYYVLVLVTVYFYECKIKKFYVPLSLAPIAMLCLSFIPFRGPIENAVYFINVGQGDSILIHNRSIAVLVDTGGSLYRDIANESLIPFFKKKGISDIDLLITTHDDYDHMGARDTLIENFTVHESITAASAFPIQIGDLYLENLNVYADFDSEENDKSLVILFEFIGRKFLLMGDASKEIELQILADNPSLDCDILKAGHHGSNTSSDPSFISAISPTDAIISSGAGNYYGHPHDEVIKILESNNINIRRTDEEGTIRYA